MAASGCGVQRGDVGQEVLGGAGAGDQQAPPGAAEIWLIAVVSTSRWSVTVLLPLLPARSLTAGDSCVLSHQAVRGDDPTIP